MLLVQTVRCVPQCKLHGLAIDLDIRYEIFKDRWVLCMGQQKGANVGGVGWLVGWLRVQPAVQVVRSPFHEALSSPP